MDHFNLIQLPDSVEKTDDNLELQIYSYSSCTNESSDEQKAFRGLVFNGDMLVASSLGYTPEYNETCIPDVDVDDYTFFSSEEGTLLRVYHFNSTWYISTHRKLDAFKSKWGSNQSFGDIFLTCLGKSFEELTSTLCQFHVYFFLIRSTKETRIVSQEPDTPTVYHVGTLLNNEMFDMSLDINVPKQSELLFQTMEEVTDYVTNSDPFKSQGVIAFKKDGSGSHFKILNSKYQMYVKVRNNEPDTSFRFLQLWRDQTDSSEEYQLFLELYPQYKKRDQLYLMNTLKLAKYLQNMYFKKFVKKEKMIFQKDEWHILQNVHRWYWVEKDTRKVTFDVMHKLALSDMNIRSFHRLLKKNN